MSWLVDLIYIPAALAYLPFLIFQMLVQKKNRRGWKERFGFVRRRVGHKPCIWVHAVSLGEVNATRSLIAEIERRLPAYDIVVSATTDTGHAAARRLYDPKLVFRYPLDFSIAVRRVLSRIRPDAIILMELEVWPNLIRLAERRGIPVGIANGRVTEGRSMKRYRLPVIRTVARSMFGRVRWIGAQTETYARRFVELGALADRVTVCGALKYDTAVIADRVEGDAELADSMGIDRDRPLIVAGSTGPKEEALLLDAFAASSRSHAGLQLAIVPRKPERFDEVARLIADRGFLCVRRSDHPDLLGQAARTRDRQRSVEKVKRRRTVESPEKSIVFLGDTLGELRKFYALADAVFVGRSLVPMGGSDVMEVAGLGKAMCFGPHMDNFSDVVERLMNCRGAVRVERAEQLSAALDRLLDDPTESEAMGRRARDVVRRNVGATAATIGLLCQTLGRRADYADSSISTMTLAGAEAMAKSNGVRSSDAG